MRRRLVPALLVPVVMFYAAVAQAPAPVEAIRLRQQGIWAEAGRAWQSVVERDPHDAAAFASLGFALSKEQTPSPVKSPLSLLHPNFLSGRFQKYDDVSTSGHDLFVVPPSGGQLRGGYLRLGTGLKARLERVGYLERPIGGNQPSSR